MALEPQQAQVVTKFCFDFNKDCAPGACPDDKTPGLMEIKFFGGRRSDGKNSTNESEPEVYVALLDDEYFSFPEVSQVWGEANCTEVRRAAKKSYRIDWKKTTAIEASAFGEPTRVVEHVRPRWWYVALVSCSPYGVEMSYSMHLKNPLQGWQSELSMDAVGVGWLALLLCGLFAGIAALQLSSAVQWASTCSPGGDVDSQFKTGRSRRILKLHPAIFLLSVAALLASAGEAAWLLHYWDLQSGGGLETTWATVGRALRTSAKTLLSVLLMLLARGQCVCTPDIAWDEHREIVGGLFVFGFFSFWLETWGDSEFRTTTTEYIYDTRAGMVLVAFDLVYLWLYASRSFSTWQAETRIKPRTFYKLYGFPLALWFATLPLVSVLAAQLSTWVRFKVTFAMNGLAHALALAVLVHSFRPPVARGLYELSCHEYQAVNHEELEGMDQMIRDEDFI